MKKNFQKVAPRRLGDIFIPWTVHKQPQSEGSLSDFPFPSLDNNILAHTRAAIHKFENKRREERR